MKFLKDTKITIGMAMAVIMQASGVIWYIAQLDSNLTSLKTTIQVQAGQINTLNVQMSQLTKDFNIASFLYTVMPFSSVYLTFPK